MLALGLFIFSMHTAAYQAFKQQSNWNHASNSRVGMRPAYQFIGQGETTITLSGWIPTEVVGTTLSLDMLEAMANTGKAFMLVSGLGYVHGAYIIESLSRDESNFFNTGRARKVEFSITLKKVEDSLVDMLIGDLKLPDFKLL